MLRGPQEGHRTEAFSNRRDNVADLSLPIKDVKTKLRNDFGECRAWTAGMCGTENAMEDDNACCRAESMDGVRE